MPALGALVFFLCATGLGCLTECTGITVPPPPRIDKAPWRPYASVMFSDRAALKNCASGKAFTGTSLGGVARRNEDGLRPKLICHHGVPTVGNFFGADSAPAKTSLWCRCAGRIISWVAILENFVWRSSVFSGGSRLFFQDHTPIRATWLARECVTLYPQEVGPHPCHGPVVKEERRRSTLSLRCAAWAGKGTRISFLTGTLQVLVVPSCVFWKRRNLVDLASKIRLSWSLSHACVRISSYTTNLHTAH